MAENDPTLLDSDPAAGLRTARSGRPGAAAVIAEIDRLNQAVGAQAAAHLDPFDEAVHFRRAMLAGAQAKPTRAGPVKAASYSGAPLTLAAQAEALQAGTLSSEELVHAALARHEAWQPHINAFISVEPEEAMAAARASDTRRARGGVLGPLDGLPMAHKDMFDRTGKVATGGSKILADRVADSTSTVAARLEAAGAIWLGGLNMAEFAASPTGINPHYGAIRNPWNTEYIAGGSSSGSGAAAGARIVAAALGSDTGGSIRLPAAVCGVVGVKPSYGRVSRAGVMPRAVSLDTVGPLAATALDCALLLAAVAGPDPLDPSALDLPIPDPARVVAADPASFTVAVLDSAVLADMAPDLVARHEAARAMLQRLGVRMVSARMDWMDEIYALADTISKCEAATLHGRWMRERPQDYSPLVFARTMSGFHIPATRYVEALAMRGRFLDRFITDVLGEADVLFLPSMPIAVPRIDTVDVAAGSDVARVIMGLTRLSRPFNYLGVPAISVPCGMDDAGLPVGFQLVGRPFSEERLLGLAHLYQMATGWADEVPAVP
ncbi:amidase [Acidisphaera sp. L21]|uniref:amidase n=1 Tax=Acidisphaera sp. L21 TaxID=1641851 RepID=UPI00131B807B|nr:amidase [Acidisphaera sp. L21]